jgi:hypothetical protein
MKSGATVDPRMVPGLARDFPKLVDIQARTDGRTATGSIVPAWTTRPGLNAIPCRKGVPSMSAGGTEKRTPMIAVVEENDAYIVLAGYFPQISSKDCALFEGVRWDIVNINSDSAGALTYLKIRALNPVADQGV